MSAALAGCGVGSSGSPTTGSIPAVHTVQGAVHGGQQPVVGASIALYAAGTTGIGSAARSVLSQTVTTNANGNFNLPGPYSCNAGDQVYLAATGGDAGAGPNGAIALMAALGPCATFQANAATIFINVDEVTTVASVYSLAAFMTGIQNVGADAAHANAMAAAFANTQTMVNLASGQAPALSTGNGIVPVTTINSLANSIANCINSSPASGSCANLFSAATGPAGTATDTVLATLNVALNPAGNPIGVYNQATPASPFQPTLGSAPSTYALTVQHPSDVLMYHNDTSRTGLQSFETTLTPANVNATQFGKLFSYTVDSYLFAQPLYVGGVGMPDGVVHNVLVAATTHGSVYAFDADGGGSIWTVSYIPSGERYATASDYGGCGNPPEAGIVGTPVIDRASQTLYFVTKSVTTSGTPTFYHRLHAVSLLDGSEVSGSPTIINPSFSGTGTGNASGTLSFNGQWQSQRSALLLTTNGSGTKTVWIAYASQCDEGPYHGLMLGYNANGMVPVATFNSTPNGGEGGFWGSNGGPVADAQGNIFALAGNGSFDANTGGLDYGDTALKLAPPTAGASYNAMTVADSFTPSNQQTLQQHDLDLGGNEPILFTDTASGVASNLMIASDKNGYIYLINRDNMGKYNTGTHGINATNGDVQDFDASGLFIWNFAWFNNTLYTSNPLLAYTYTPGTATTAGQFNTTPTAQSSAYGAPPLISANGTANGLVWTEPANGPLSVYSASTLALLYESSTAGNGRDTPPTYVKFAAPVVANGKAYLGGKGSLAVYGLLP